METAEKRKAYDRHFSGYMQNLNAAEQANMETDIRILIRESHRRQFAGEDYQAVTIDIATANNIPYSSEDFTQIMSAPSEDCNCGFCKTAPWID